MVRFDDDNDITSTSDLLSYKATHRLYKSNYNSIRLDVLNVKLIDDFKVTELFRLKTIQQSLDSMFCASLSKIKRISIKTYEYEHDIPTGEYVV